MKLCWSTLGTATVQISPSALPLNGFPPCIFMDFTRRNNRNSARIQAAPCAANVAHAAPTTPILNGIMRMQSRITLPTELAISRYSGVLLSPRLLKIPVTIL